MRLAISNIAWDAPAKVFNGFTRPTNRSSNSKVPKACIANASSTASANIANEFQSDGWAEIGRLNEDLGWVYLMLDAKF